MKTRSPRKRRPAAHHFRPRCEQLETRDLLAAPVIDPLTTVAPFVPTNKTIFIPITATDPQGEPLSFSVNSSNPLVSATFEPTTNTYLRLNVAGFGEMDFQLFGDLAPDTVSRIEGLVQSGFYNGLTFHRVASGFVIQGGDPNGNGTGGPGFTFKDEFNPNAIFSGSGQLALANSGRDTNGSQFFITVAAERQSLDFGFNLYGQLVRGFDVLKAIDALPTTPTGDGMPKTPVVITNASLFQDNHDAVLLLKSTSGIPGSSLITITAQNSAGETSEAITFSATVVADTFNDPAFLNPVANQSTPANTPVTFAVSGTDLENDALTFTANLVTPNPNVTVSVAGNMVTVTPMNGFAGPVQVLIGVTEAGQAKPDTHVITVAVGARQPTAAAGTPVSGTEAQLLNAVVLGSFTDAAPGVSVNDYTVSINWGDGHVSTGGLHLMPGGVFQVVGSNTYAQAGVYPVNVTVTLNSSLGGNVVTLHSTATIAEAPLSSQGVAVTGTAGQALQNVVVASVTDPNPTPIVANFAALIDWGDGSQPTPGIVQAGPAGTLQVLGTHTYTAAGSFTVSTTVRDSNSGGLVPDATTTATATASIAMIITPPPPAVGQENAHFVTGLYRVDLRRAAQDNELVFWEGVLAAGISRIQVAYFIEISPEHRLLQIGDLYNNLLGRKPTLVEQLNGLNIIQGSGSLRQLKAHILASPEYFQNRANNDQTTFLQVVSIDALGNLLPTGRANYFGLIFRTSPDREKAVLALLNTKEGLTAAVQTDFQDALTRPASQADVNEGLVLEQQGVTDELLRAILFASDEGLRQFNAQGNVATVTG